MAISQTMCSSFKLELAKAIHNFETDVFKIALFTSAATLNADTTVYGTAEEVAGTGYVAGGNVLTGVTLGIYGTTLCIDWVDAEWLASTITARGALIYNSSKADKAVVVLDFGSDKSSNNSTFPVTFPANTASAAIVRIL